MLIRSEQMAQLEQAMAAQFEAEMQQHLREFAPRHSQIIGPEGVRQVVRLGMERSANCEFTNRGPIRLYLEMMFMFGSDFATDPQYKWAAAILGNKEADQMDRAERLFAAVKAYLERIGGPRNEYSIASLRRMSDGSLQKSLSPGGSFVDTVLAAFRAAYPQKAEHVGEANLRELIAEGQEQAKAHGITGTKGTVALLGLMYAVGHGVITDPLFPWVAATLKDPAVADPNARAERLGERAIAYLKHALAYLEKKES